MKNQFKVTLSADVATVTSLPAGLDITADRADQLCEHVLDYFRSRESDEEGNSEVNKFDLYSHASSIAENANELAFSIGFAETTLSTVSGRSGLGQILHALMGGN